jgi:hypothetical protein
MTPPMDQISVAADVRQIRDAVTQLQISVSKIDDLVTRLDRVEIQQKEAATEMAKFVNNQSNNGKLLQQYFPWIIAFLASGGMLTDGVVSAVTGPPSQVAIESLEVLDPLP